MSIEAIALGAVRTDGGTQARGALDAAWVDELAAVVADGDGALDAITVFYDGAAYWLADGFHRVAAYAKAGRGIIKPASILARHGLNPDVSRALASEAMEALAANRWRAPAWLLNDPRFALKKEGRP
jgi:hypothetical protein